VAESAADIRRESVLRRACAELDQRLRDGEDVRSESLLDREPELAAHPEAAVELIYTEFVTRQQLGQQPDTTQFARRFPRWKELLEEQFQIHALLGDYLESPRPTPAEGITSQEGSSAGSASGLWLGRYQLGKELGRGGHGVVFRAQDTQLHRPVAIKVLLAGSHASPQDLQRWRLEAEVVASLGHPNIVQVLEVGTHEGHPAIALELVDGQSLAQRSAGRQQPAQDTAVLVETLARAVHFAHERGIVHRDLKPANVLLTPEGVPKITDFGLARRMIGDSSETKTGAMLGTPSYMAPEQTGVSRYVGPATDVYSLGAILYEQLTGKPPFEADTALDTARQVVYDEPVPPRRWARVPRDLETICLKCLAKEPYRRYATAGALADDLHRYLAGEPIQARPVGWGPRAIKWSQRHPAGAALVGVSALAAAALFAMSLIYTASLKDSNDRLTQSLTETEGQRLRAEDEKSKAEQQSELYREELNRAQRGLYALQLAQVEGLWKTDPGRGQELLLDPELCPERLRDFTWRYYARLCRREQVHLAGHQSPVDRLALSPDGRTLATAALDGVILWDVEARTQRAKLSRFDGAILALGFTADSTKLAACTNRGAVSLWDVRSGVLQSEPAVEVPASEETSATPKLGLVNAAAFSSGARWVALGEETGVITLRETPSGRRLSQWTAHDSAVTGLAISAGDNLLAASSQAGKIRIWQIDASAARPPEVVKTNLPDHSDLITALAFSPDGKCLAAGGRNETVKVWNVSDGRQQAELGGHLSPVLALAFSPDGDTLATASRDMGVKLWQIGEYFRPLITFKGATREVRDVIFQRDGQALWTGGGDSLVRLWDVVGVPAYEALDGHKGRIMSLAFSPQNDLLASASRDQTLRVWQLSTGQVRFRKDRMHRTRGMAFSPDGLLLLTASEDRHLRLWNVADGELVREFMDGANTCHEGAVFGLALSPDGKLAATASDDKTVKLWRVPSGERVATLQFESQASAVVFTPDGQMLLAAGREPGIKFWSVQGILDSAVAGSPVAVRQTLAGHQDWVHALAVSRHGLLASGSYDETARLWDLHDGKSRQSLRGHKSYVMFAAFSPDGETLATADGDRWAAVTGEVKLWDPATGQVRATLGGQSGPVVFSPNGEMLATGTEEGEVRLWRAPKP